MSITPAIAESIYGDDLYQIAPKMLIILPKLWEEISVDEKSQLSKILAAVKLSLDSVQIITRDAVLIESLLILSPSKVISFGVPLHPDVNPYENTEAYNIRIIYADALHILDDSKKRNLWLALKNMFGV